MRLAGLTLTGVVAGELGIDVASLVRGGEIYYPVTKVPTKRLPEPWWVVQLADPHIGGVGMDMVNTDVCKQVANTTITKLQSLGAKPERTVLAFVGDGVIGDTETELLTPMDMFMEGMHSFDAVPAQWRFSVQGNHDVRWMERHKGNLQRANEKLGYEVLGWNNEDRTVVNSAHMPFQVVGTPDYTTNPEWYLKPDKSFFSDLQKGKPTIWLTHNASPFDECGWGESLAQNDYNLTVLCGHTHGGQISGPSVFQLIGESYALSTIDYKSGYISGMYACGGDVRINVCNGLGSSSAIARTAERQVSILELIPA